MNVTNFYNKIVDDALRQKTKKEDLEVLYENSDSDGSFAFPINNEELAKDNLFRVYGTVINAGSRDGEIITSSSNARAVLVDEGEEIPSQDDTFSESRYKAYKLGSITKLPIRLVHDKQFNVSKYLREDFSRRFSKTEEDLFINGSGVNEPKGILASTSAGATATELTYDKIAELYFSVPKEYRKNGTWIMNDETALALRKLKDENGLPLFNQNCDKIFGRPVAISSNMEDENKPIIFGDLSYFWILVRDDVSVRVLNEKYAISNYVGYIGKERLDGKLINFNAVKYLEITSEAKQE